MNIRALLFYIVLLFSAHGGADEAVTDEIVLTAGLPPFAPFAYPGEEHDRGTVVKIYKMLEKELNVKIDIIYHPYPRVIESMRNGGLDLAIIFKNASIEPYVTYVGEISKSKVLVITRKNIKLDVYDDLYALKNIAVLRKANFDPRFDVDERINKFTVIDYEAGLRMMNAGRVDAVVGSQSGLYEAASRLKYDIKQWPSPFLLNKKEWWVHMSNKSPHQDIIPKLKKAVQKIFEEDLVWRLYLQN